MNETKLEAIARRKSKSVQEVLDDALRQGGSREGAAEVLQMTRMTLWRAIRRHRLKITLSASKMEPEG